MVKLFKRGSKVEKKSLKLESSLKLKELPIEEYAHVTYAFQLAILRFERLLKESLLEGYITSTTLEKISREFNFAEIRKLDIPEIPSLQEIFGTEQPRMASTKKIPEVETTAPKPVTAPVSTSQPSAPSIASSIPTASRQSQPVVEEKTPIATPSPESPLSRPKISFSFPETKSTPTSTSIQPSPTPTHTKTSSTPTISTPSPSIPKISFPTLSKPTSPSSSSLLGQSTGRREEDRATGIAILRKQMLTELKKIRSVVSEEDR
ncbi:MAG: hypothetical protein ACXAC8_05850 [Candidatus Hodarchaeales archaeon]